PVAWLILTRGIRGISHLRRHPQEILLLPVVVLVVILIALPIKAFAFVTMNKQGWLTRSAEAYGGDGQTSGTLEAPAPSAAPVLSAPAAPARELEHAAPATAQPQEVGSCPRSRRSSPPWPGDWVPRPWPSRCPSVRSRLSATGPTARPPSRPGRASTPGTRPRRPRRRAPRTPGTRTAPRWSTPPGGRPPRAPPPPRRRRPARARAGGERVPRGPVPGGRAGARRGPPDRGRPLDGGLVPVGVRPGRPTPHAAHGRDLDGRPPGAGGALHPRGARRGGARGRGA